MSFLRKKHKLIILLVVASLGYFVDIYDLVLFGMLRVSSLQGLGLSGAELTKSGVHLLNMQMLGMLLGGILWGVLGDKKGRLTVLFGSICMYSLANLANAFVTTVPMYGLLRFVAGIGLAGELGAGVTLVTEVMSKRYRGYGVTMVATIGVLGAVSAAMTANMFPWRINYMIGGALGLALLVLRIGSHESGMFESVKKNKLIKRGDFLAIFRYKDLFYRYVLCVLVGVPIWYMIGIVVMFSPELALAMGVVGEVSVVTAILCCYIGLMFGDFASGLLSQWFRSRRSVMLGFIGMSFLSVMVTLSLAGISVDSYYGLCFWMGVFGGYWALFITVSAEQFGTNFRATVATTVPNFVRGSVVAMTMVLAFLQSYMGYIEALVLLGISVFVLAAASVYKLSETFHRDLDFVEELP
jgi:predicted MFS family arabinose efflux permease